MHQFTFICAVAKVNACQTLAQAKHEPPTPQVEFWRELAKQLLNNTLDAPTALPQAVVAARWRSNTVHMLTKRGQEQGKWNPCTRRF
jgi:hypothetical protein